MGKIGRKPHLPLDQQIIVNRALYYSKLTASGVYNIRPHDGIWTGLYPYLYTVAILRGWEMSYDIMDRWCYPSRLDAECAFIIWDGTGEPEGWVKHVQTNRCRVDGDPARETIGWPPPRETEE